MRDTVSYRSSPRGKDLFALLRRYTGASQSRIGMRAGGISQGEVSKIVNGVRQIENLHVFEAIADGLDMPDEQRILLGLAPSYDDADVKRRNLLRYAFAGGAVAALPADVVSTGGSHRSPAGASDALQQLAWELSRRRAVAVHPAELSRDVAHTLLRVSAERSSAVAGLLVWASDGTCGFVHSSLIDLAARSADAVAVLDGWMRHGRDPLLRVNSAGVLAKLGHAESADSVVGLLRVDPETRHLYVTAVLARVLGVDWRRANDLAAAVDSSGHIHAANEAAHTMADRLSREAQNPRDAGARWSSVVVLSRLDARSQRVSQALTDALSDEPSREVRRAMGRVLASADPLVA